MTDITPEISLTAAIKNHDLDAIKALLGQNTDVNKKDINGTTPLMYAAAIGYPEVVRLLLDGGADQTAKNIDGSTALKIAMEYNRHNIVAMLKNYPLELDKKIAARTKELQDKLKSRPMPQLRRKGGV